MEAQRWPRHQGCSDKTQSLSEAADRLPPSRARSQNSAVDRCFPHAARFSSPQPNLTNAFSPVLHAIRESQAEFVSCTLSQVFRVLLLRMAELRPHKNSDAMWVRLLEFLPERLCSGPASLFCMRFSKNSICRIAHFLEDRHVNDS